MLQYFVGKTKTKNVIDESYKIYQELFEKRFPNYFETNHSKAFAFVTTTKDKEILDAGMSKVNDLLSDNWGNFLRAFLSGDQGLNNVYRNTGNQLVSFQLWGDTTKLFNRANTGLGTIGTRIATGSGTTDATRQDVDIEIEKNKADTGDGGWNSGLGKIDIPMTATGVSNYSLTETALFGTWFASQANAIEQILLAHDNISPVSVLVGQTINVDYQLLLS